MNTELASCLIINAPEWYERPEFLRLLNRPTGERQTATWHNGGQPDEFSDIFLVYDNGEGSDIFQEEGLEDIWDLICDLAQRHGMQYGVVWIKNIGEEA